MEEFTSEDINYINNSFNFYDKIYIKWIENIEIKNLTEKDIQRFQEKQKKNIIELKWRLTERKKH